MQLPHNQLTSFLFSKKSILLSRHLKNRNTISFPPSKWAKIFFQREKGVSTPIHESSFLESNLAERVRQLKICVFYSISRLFQGEKDLDEDTT